MAVATTAVAATPTFSVRGTQTASGHTLVQTATGHIVRAEPTRKLIAVTCTATALPDGIATGVAECYLLGLDGRRFHAGDNRSNPGPIDVASAALTVPRQPYRLCVRSNAQFAGGSYQLTGNTYCSAWG